MITKELAKKAQSGIEDIPDWFPLGQRILMAGYKETNTEEIHEIIIKETYDEYSKTQGDLCWTKLEWYISEIIPDKAMRDIREAMTIGLVDFRVYWVSKKKKKLEDPIVVALLGERCNYKQYYITRW